MKTKIESLYILHSMTTEEEIFNQFIQKIPFKEFEVIFSFDGKKYWEYVLIQNGKAYLVLNESEMKHMKSVSSIIHHIIPSISIESAICYYSSFKLNNVRYGDLSMCLKYNQTEVWNKFIIKMIEYSRMKLKYAMALIEYSEKLMDEYK